MLREGADGAHHPVGALGSRWVLPGVLVALISLAGCSQTPLGTPVAKELYGQKGSRVADERPALEYDSPSMDGVTGAITPSSLPRPTVRLRPTSSRTATSAPPAVLDLPPATPVSGERAPVTLTLEDAERRAVALTIPLNAARVERSGHIGRDAFVSALGSERGVELDVDRYGHSYVVFEEDEIEEPIIVVEVSRRGFSFPDDRCPIDSSPSARDLVTTFFSARSGDIFGHSLGSVQVWDQESVWDGPMLYETPTPTSTSTTDSSSVDEAALNVETPLHNQPEPATVNGWHRPRPLAKGEYPAGVRDMIAAVPLTVGSTWRYRRVSVSNGVEWEEGTVSATIAAGWRWTDDVMEVSFQHEGATPWIGWGEPRFILPRSVLPRQLPGSLRDSQVPSANPALALDTLTEAINNLREQERRWTEQDEDPIEIMRLPVEAGREANYWFAFEARETVTVGAGTFPGCFRIREILSAGWTALHWFCPGVGFARHHILGGGGAGLGCSVFELEAYDLPWRVPVR